MMGQQQKLLLLVFISLNLLYGHLSAVFVSHGYQISSKSFVGHDLVQRFRKTPTTTAVGENKFSTEQQYNNMSTNHLQEISPLSLTASGGDFQPSISMVATLTTTTVTNAMSTMIVPDSVHTHGIYTPTTSSTSGARVRLSAIITTTNVTKTTNVIKRNVTSIYTVSANIVTEITDESPMASRTLLLTVPAGCLVVMTMLVFCIIICVCCQKHCYHNKNNRSNKQQMMNMVGITDQSYFIDYFQLDHGYKQSCVDNSSEPFVVDNNEKQLETAHSLPFEHTEKDSFVETITAKKSQEWKESQQVDTLKTLYEFSTFQNDSPSSETKDQMRLTKGSNNPQLIEHTTVCTPDTLSQRKPTEKILLQEHPNLTSCTTKDITVVGELHLNVSSNASHSFFGKIRDLKDDDNRLNLEMEHLEIKQTDVKKHASMCTQETLSQTKPAEKILLQEHHLTPCTTKDVAEVRELYLNASSNASHSFYGKIRDSKDDDDRLNLEAPEMEHLETKQKDGREVHTVTPVNLGKLILEAPAPFSGTKVKEEAKKALKELSPVVKTPEVSRVASVKVKEEAKKALKELSPVVKTPEVSRVASVKSSDGTTKLANNMCQDGEQCDSKDICYKLQRWPVHRRQVKEMVTLKVSPTKDRTVTIPNHKAGTPMNSRESNQDNNATDFKVEDYSLKRASTSLSKYAANQTSTKHLTKEAYIKHSKQDTINSEPPNDTAVPAGSDEHNGRKVGQPTATTTRVEHATEVESVRVSKDRRLLVGRLKQHFVKLLRNHDQECTECPSRDRLQEGHRHLLMSKWKRRQKRNRTQDNITVESTCTGYTTSKSEKQTSGEENACGSLHVDKLVKNGEPRLPERGYLEDIDFVVDEFDMILRTTPELPARNYLEDIDFVSEEFELFFRRKSKQENKESTQRRESTSSAEEGLVPHHPITDDELFYDQNPGGMPGVTVGSHYQPLLFNKGEQCLQQESEYVRLPPLDASLRAPMNIQNPIESPQKSLVFEGKDPQNKYDHDCASFKPTKEASKLRDTSRNHNQPQIFDSRKEGIISIPTKPLKSSKISPSTFMIEESRMNVSMSYSNKCPSASVSPDSDTELPGRRLKHSLPTAAESS